MINDKNNKKKPCYGYNVEGAPILNQEDKAFDYMLRTGGRVSNKFMADKWGFRRCGALIHRLKKQLIQRGGEYVLRDEWKSGPDRWGVNTRYKEWWLEKVEKDNDNNEEA